MPKPHVADILERCAQQLHSVAFDFRDEAEGIEAAERRIDHVERICADARASVRGNAA